MNSKSDFGVLNLQDKSDFLFDLLDLNEIKEVTCYYDHDRPVRTYPRHDIKVFPRSKFPLVYEPVVLGIWAGMDVATLISWVCRDEISSSINSDIMDDEFNDYTVTLFTKNRRIVIDKVGS